MTTAETLANTNDMHRVEERLKRVRLVVMDVDGTLTDGSLYYSAEGHMLKQFHVRDGMGIVLLHKAGLSSAFLTSENSPIIQIRAEKLHIHHIFQSSRNKKRDIVRLSKQANVDVQEIAYIGDDVNDELAMQSCGFRACPSDAAERIKRLADYVCQNPGGRGAVREVIEVILQAQGKSLTLEEEW